MMSSKNSFVLARRVCPKTRNPTKWRVSLKIRRIRTKRTTRRKPRTSLAALEDRPLKSDSHQELKCKPDHTDTFDVGEKGFRLCFPVVPHLGVIPDEFSFCLVHNGVKSLVGLEAEGQNMMSHMYEELLKNTTSETGSEIPGHSQDWIMPVTKKSSQFLVGERIMMPFVLAQAVVADGLAMAVHSPQLLARARLKCIQMLLCGSEQSLPLGFDCRLIKNGHFRDSLWDPVCSLGSPSRSSMKKYRGCTGQQLLASSLCVARRRSTSLPAPQWPLGLHRDPEIIVHSSPWSPMHKGNTWLFPTRNWLSTKKVSKGCANKNLQKCSKI
ncbi:hypothetical protein DV515_00002470 [Chloebia gouldiae]|uniref:Uncharacterized protein n=1 Tax=Chloebia gouldiae TaxID=44316 RepID=A0A3L8SXU5_CHLGU|nr:hypothetical protein DV515_00002470 [Chloebia gouldiae]